MDIFEALLQSHARQRAICRRLLDGVGNAKERLAALEELKSEMAAHETAEERTFYVPLIAHDETVDAARHGIAEHHEMDEMVEDLDKADPGSAEWLEVLGKLVHKVGHHLDEEEQKFFPQAREVLSRGEQKSLGEPYRQEHERLVEKEENEAKEQQH
jgi:hemerythrin-like domain-containing protein